MKSDSTLSDLVFDTQQELVDFDDEKPSCWQKLKRTKILAAYFNYEYAKEIKLFPIGFRDPVL